MLSRLYKMLWSRLGGRYWTWIAREGTRASPLQWLFMFFLVGIVVGQFLSISGVLWFVFVLFLGIIVGHVWWGTPPSTWNYPGGPDG